MPAGFPQVAFLLLAYRAGAAWGDGAPPVQIQASAGGTAILPCHTSVIHDHPTVEWSKEGLDQNIALLYRDGCETHEEKNPVFWYRTSLIMKELKDGNISLRISNLLPSDAGKYICKTIWRGVHTVVTVELFVGSVSEPKLLIVPAKDGGVTLQCEANCWYPEPEITFLDDQGNKLSAEDPKTKQDPGRFFNITRRMTVPTHTNRIVCRVHQPKINQTRVADIYIPADCMRSCTPITSIAVIVTILVCVSTAIGCKKCGNSGWAQKLPMCQRNSRNIRDAATELLEKIDELSPQDKEKIIRQLTEKPTELRQHGQPTTDDSLSRSSPDVSNPNLPSHQPPNNPKPEASPNSNHPKSVNLAQSKDSSPGSSIQSISPAPATDVAAASPSPPSAWKSEGGHVVRSKSVSESGRRLNHKPQRRSTISLATNPFSPVPEAEDSEPLL